MKNNMKNGFLSNLPISLSVFSYGAILGITCNTKSIDYLELMLMNIFIFAGSSQFVIADMISSSFGIATIIGTAVLINLRYFLIGTTLNTLFFNRTLKEKLLIMHFVTDESWAITMKNREKDIDVYFLLGGGLCIFSSWLLGTSIGYFSGQFILDPQKYGLDFAFYAVFIAILTTMYKSKNDFYTFLITAIIAISLDYLLNNPVYILISAVLGSLLSLLFVKKKESNE
ncbi:AzlC family ABC transporter permease [Halarcobacter anaerophilus]|jgi:4-azaleucine resistance transporter AzlC|uniref:Branched-chain amino acid permease n=1 Tax=Halarcobacter anaerophilus TaxID=877500 RepID=A0A4Q0Y5S4_9BACT|nr:AzlC family ABC transporter permease [Halarcobacter anaerophilus]QDF27827.1 branched-chain amino acid transport protein, AzlC family [Halarcobacter anaerophilus]RXJ64169.1 branched-chain amino acid permease [Halarcobacter anaerophilus]